MRERRRDEHSEESQTFKQKVLTPAADLLRLMGTIFIESFRDIDSASIITLDPDTREITVTKDLDSQ
jgi:hypothetical protein